VPIIRPTILLLSAIAAPSAPVTNLNIVVAVAVSPSQLTRPFQVLLFVRATTSGLREAAIPTRFRAARWLPALPCRLLPLCPSALTRVRLRASPIVALSITVNVTEATKHQTRHLHSAAIRFRRAACWGARAIVRRVVAGQIRSCFIQLPRKAKVLKKLRKRRRRRRRVWCHITLFPSFFKIRSNDLVRHS
jgi:hypothetical protein